MHRYFLANDQRIHTGETSYQSDNCENCLWLKESSGMASDNTYLGETISVQLLGYKLSSKGLFIKML